MHTQCSDLIIDCFFQKINKSALLFLFPRTNIYGTLLLSSYMGGAIILHMTGGLSIVLPSVVLILIWAVGFLRNPELIKK